MMISCDTSATQLALKSYMPMGDGPGTAVEIGPCRMDRGTYYVGDLMHVLDTAAWDELMLLRNGTWGKFTLKNGRIVVIYNCPSNGYRRRMYDDLQGRVYELTSATFGCTLKQGLENEYSDKGLPVSMFKVGETWDTTLEQLAHSVHYKKKFDCFSIVETLVNGRVFGGDCEIAFIRMGCKIMLNTEEADLWSLDEDGW